MAAAKMAKEASKPAMSVLLAAVKPPASMVSKKPAEGDGDAEAGAVAPDLRLAAKQLLAGIEASDPDAVAKALKSAVSCCGGDEGKAETEGEEAAPVSEG